MKKIIIFWLIVLVGIGAYFGYYGVQRRLINMELSADLEDSWAYQQSISQSQLGQFIKEQLSELSKQEDAQLRQLAKSSKTLKEYQQQKGIFLEQTAQEDQVKQVLQRAKERAIRKE